MFIETLEVFTGELMDCKIITAKYINLLYFLFTSFKTATNNGKTIDRRQH